MFIWYSSTHGVGSVLCSLGIPALMVWVVYYVHWVFQHSWCGQCIMFIGYSSTHGVGSVLCSLGIPALMVWAVYYVHWVFQHSYSMIIWMALMFFSSCPSTPKWLRRSVVKDNVLCRFGMRLHMLSFRVIDAHRITLKEQLSQYSMLL